MKNIIKRNNVNVLGEGKKTMLFAHGFGCDQNVWSYITGEFTEDYKLVLFDYVGAGNSDLSAYNSSRYGTLAGYSQDILEICEDLNLKDTVFIGHSVSSMTGLLAAIECPDYFQKLVFVGPSPRYLNDEGYFGGFERPDLEGLFEMMDSNYLGWSRSLAPAIMGNPHRPELGEQLTRNFCATDPDIAREFARVTFLSDNRSDLSKLKVESLTLQCAEDIIAPVQVGEYVHQNTPGNSFVMLDATGHCAHMSAPDQTVRAIKEFIR